MDAGGRRRSVSRKRSPVHKRLEKKREQKDVDSPQKIKPSFLKRFKNNLACCLKSICQNSKGNQQDFQLKNSQKVTSVPQKVQKKRTEGEKIPHKRPGDKRKTLVIEANDILVHFRNVVHKPSLLGNKTISQVTVRPQDNSSQPKFWKEDVSESSKPIIRPSFEEFISEILTYFEVILWTTTPRLVRIHNLEA